jgi:hypothetical protein
MRALLTAVLFCANAGTVRAQAKVLPGFGTIAEGVTSPNRTSGIDVAYRMFSLPTFNRTCKESQQPSRLASPNKSVALNLGEWFPLHRLIIVGVDRTGHVLRPLPIMLEVEVTNPPLLNLQSEMISDARLLPIRTGRFRFCARTICKGTSADVFIQAVIRPQ